MSVALRRQLQLLALITVAALVGKALSLAAPLPIAETPTTLHLPGYDTRQVGAGSQPRQGRELSHGTQRVFRLVPASGEPMLTLRLLPVRSRRGSEVSEQTDGLNGLNMEAVGALAPAFALRDRRILSVVSPQHGGEISSQDQIALGRAPAEPSGSITRLQTCLSPSGVAGLHSSILVAESQKPDHGAEPAWQRQLRRLAGLSQTRYECMAVQLESEGGEGVKGAVDRRGTLESTWNALGGVLRGQLGARMAIPAGREP